MRRAMSWRRNVLVVSLALLAAAAPAGAQRTAEAFGVCVPMAQRAGRDVGCFIVAEHAIGTLGAAPLYWHVTRLADGARAERRRDADTGSSTEIQAFGSTWLLTIADSAWRPTTGRRVAIIGPLPITAGLRYSATYMEASMRPGMKSMVHEHPGPEAWYTMSGETCLETPTGTQVGRSDNAPVIVPGGVPMELTATGTGIRRSIVLILHDAAKPPATMVAAWRPTGACLRSKSP